MQQLEKDQVDPNVPKGTQMICTLGEKSKLLDNTCTITSFL